jgi:WD40 repeat protein/serine/threonine protein kinase
MTPRADRDLGLEMLTDSQLWRLDQICDGFESAWRAGLSPRIEDLLEEASSPDRDVLARELILIEVDLRRDAGEGPAIDEYRRRFPELELSAVEARAVDSLRAEPSPFVPPGDRASEHLGIAAEGGASARDARPRRLGHFQLLKRVGVGGFGTVWRARDTRLDRVVALKVPHAHLIASPEEIARFYREARAIAQLRHPGIVTVHEVPVIDGLPTLVCDFVTGRSLRELAASRRLGTRTIASLMARLADAVDYAHSMGSIHRDLKPANIMLDPTAAGDRDGDAADGSSPGEPRIVDFGLAYLDRESIHLTHNGTIIGTPAYMSPEQAAGLDPAAAIDHRTDIYSLGVILYELLTGSIPFSGTRHEVLDKVVHCDPPSPRRLARSIPRDLESICLKAMAKEPRHRYASARELADDLRHFLECEPVRARPINLWQKCLRRAQRRPAQAGLLLMGVVTLLAMIGLAIGFQYHLRLQREFQATEMARNAADQERRRAEGLLYFNRMALAEREWTTNNIARVERLLDECPPHLRGWEWRYLKRQCRHELATLDSTESPAQSWTVTSVRFSPDGRRIASASKGGSLLLWDVASGLRLGKLGESGRPLYGLAFEPGSGRLAAGGEDGTIRIWDPDASRVVRTIQTGAETIYALAYSPDGRLLASGHGFPTLEEVDHMRGRGVIRIWDVPSGTLLHTLRGHSQNLMGLAFSPDGGTLASVSGSWLAVPQAASRPGELVLWNARTGAMIHRAEGHTGPLTGLAYDPAGGQIATSSWDCTVRLWDARSLEPRRTLTGHQDWVLAVAFSPDGAHLASAGADGAIRLWDPASSAEPYTLRGHTKNVTCLAFSPDGRRLASGSSDQTIKLWDAGVRRDSTNWRGADGPIARIGFFPDGRRLLVAANREDPAGRFHPHLVVLDTVRNRETPLPLDRADGGRGRPVDGAAIRPDGKLIATACLSGHVAAWSEPDWAPAFRHDEPTSRFQTVAISPDGRLLAAAGQVNAYFPSGEAMPNLNSVNALLVVFDLETGRELWRDAGAATGIIRDLAFHPDGRMIASADNVGSVTLWDAETGQVRDRLRGHHRVVSHIAFSPDGQKLASASWDSTVAVWSLSLGLPVSRLQGHMRSVLCVTFSPDGRRLATSSEDRTVRLWDVRTGQELITLRGHSDIVTSVAFSPDGNRLASAGADGSVQIREAGPGPGTAEDE